MSCGVGCRLSSDPALLWLWYRPAAASLIRSLAWELPYAVGAALKSKKKKKKVKMGVPLWLSRLSILSLLWWGHCCGAIWSLDHAFLYAMGIAKKCVGREWLRWQIFCIFHHTFNLIYFNFFYGLTLSIWKFLGQGLNLSHSCELHCSCGNSRSFNPLHRPSWRLNLHLCSDPMHCSWILNPQHHSRNSYFTTILKHKNWKLKW